MAIIKGGAMMLFIEVEGGKYKSIAQATNHTLTISADTADTSSKDNGGGLWQTSEINTMNWTCNSENLLCDVSEGVTFAELFTYMTSKKKIKAVFGLRENWNQVGGDAPVQVPAESGGWEPNKGTSAPFEALTGEMFITNLTQNAPNGDNATFTVDFTGNGALTKYTAA